MNISVTDSERDLLLEVLDARYTSMLHELHHTDTNDYKQFLTAKLELLEKLRGKIQNTSNEQR